ncbi:DUF2760 domain-containing protein [Puniceicoccaceae bacterium K14]|nr:DUF2760 domain-containing protein [Puniceicoccaceae bacterium K14]
MSPKSTKPLFIIGSLLLLALGIASVVPAVQPYRDALPYSSIGLAFLLLIFAIVLKTSAPAETTKEEAPPESEPETPKPESTIPDLNAVPEQSGEVQVAQLLSILQEKGRFIDFAMGDISSYSDAQIAAAARFVHQGCQGVMKSNFVIEAISQTPENQAITLEDSFDRNEFRLVGKVGDTPPFSGMLVHKGWKTISINLPKVTGVRAEATDTHIIAPAEVEMK